MAFAIKLTSTGGPDVLVREQFLPGVPGPDEAWVEHEAIGVNYLDVMQRKGTAPLALPSGIGLEGAGRVTAIGANVTNIAVNDRVAYFLGPIGSYATGRLYPANRLVKLPDAISFDDAAAILFKGTTAQYLLHATYPVKPGTTVLLYSAAGALGQILVPWAKHLGAIVIGVVSKAESIDRARSIGCDEVFVWGECDLPAEVARVTNGKKADVVYDGVGKDTLTASLDSLAPRGLLASIGASSGQPAAVEITTLNAKGSLFLTRPSLAAYTSNLVEYHERARDVLAAAEKGIIKPSIWKTFALADARDAHAALEQGKSAGAILLKP